MQSQQHGSGTVKNHLTDDQQITKDFPKLNLAYTEVCKTYHAVDDFRAKLLALLPIASGAGVFLLLTDPTRTVDKSHVAAIGIFGVLATVGLFLHELRGLKRCGRIMEIGRDLERAMELEDAQFKGEADAQHWGGLLGAESAAYVIYGAVLAAWCYVAGVGFGWW